MSKASYDDDPERYAELTGFQSDWRDLFWRDDFLRLILRRVGPPPSAEVLDIGCGAGHWGLRLLPHLPGEARLTGLDRQPQFLESAKGRAQRLGLADACQFLPGDATRLPFDDKSFDFVTAQLVFIHIHEAEAVLAEIVRVLRPGGRVLLAEPDNLAGNHAHLNSSMNISEEDIADILALQRTCERGKIALKEGDDSIGARLPGLLQAAGFEDVDVAQNERCMHLSPPYQQAHMKIALEQELAWAEQGVSILMGAREDAQRRFLATGASEAEFAKRYAAVERWLEGFHQGIEEQSYYAARGFVMYLVWGRV